MQQTLVIITGGTIEALYTPDKGTPYHVPVPKTVEESAIPELLAKLGLGGQCEIWPFSMFDSKQLGQGQLDQIAGHIIRHGYTQVVMVQGTDTMPQNGRYLEQALCRLQASSVRLVLTGAMKPLRDEHGNWHPRAAVDGWDNVAMAVRDAANPALPVGVYLEMGEGPWKPDMVEKQVQVHAVEGKDVAYVTQSGFIRREPPAAMDDVPERP